MIINYWRHLIIGIITMVLLAGCNLIGGDSAETLADHDVKLPNGLESKLPLPKGSKVTFHFDEDDTHGITFTPGANYPDTIELFSDYFASSDWDVESENIPEVPEGERTASWNLWADGYAVELFFTAFGDEKGANMSGAYSLSARDESIEGAESFTRIGPHNQIEFRGEDLAVPENSGDIPLMDGAEIYKVNTFDEETDPEGQGYTEYFFTVESDFEDVVDYYQQALAEAGFNEEGEEHGDGTFGEGNFHLFRNNEKIHVDVLPDFDEEGIITTSITYWEDGPDS